MRIAERRVRQALACAVFVSLAAGIVAQAQAAADIVITNGNKGKKGFNDPTPVAPVGGNTGTTLGEQRLIAFRAAAAIWGNTLTTTQTINILATFEPLDCDATSAVLGSAGASKVFKDFAGAQKPNTWYPYALANKLSGTDQTAPKKPQPQIVARFNSDLGKTGCLDGSPFYLGLDNAHGDQVDLVTVLLHEFGHGLGFQTFTDGNTGAQLQGSPSIWDHYLYDDTTLKTWVAMTDAERAASARNARQLVWTGAKVTTALPGVLTLGTPGLQISGPNAGSATGNYLVGTASFGAALTTTPVTGSVVAVPAPADGTGSACTPLDSATAAAVSGRIALVDRGVCAFTVKALNVQAAGGIAMLVADNVSSTPPDGLGGSDPAVTIPAVRITLEDGARIKASLSATLSGVTASLALNGSQYAGADVFGRALMYTPNPYQGGSSVSHWDTIATRNLLMEPAINDDLLHAVVPPADLTFPLLTDIGW